MANIELIRSDIEGRLDTMSEDEKRQEITQLNDIRAFMTADPELDIRFREEVGDYIQEIINMVGGE